MKGGGSTFDPIECPTSMTTTYWGTQNPEWNVSLTCVGNEGKRALEDARKHHTDKKQIVRNKPRRSFSRAPGRPMTGKRKRKSGRKELEAFRDAYDDQRFLGRSGKKERGRTRVSAHKFCKAEKGGGVYPWTWIVVGEKTKLQNQTPPKPKKKE